MDTRTGVVQTYADEGSLRAAQAKNPFLVPVDPNRKGGMARNRRKELFRFGKTVIGERARCPCGSGHRFKRCCMGKIGEAV
jgi:uncharacterized protein YecA (UPF0149 family)